MKCRVEIFLKLNFICWHVGYVDGWFVSSQDRPCRWTRTKRRRPFSRRWLGRCKSIYGSRASSLVTASNPSCSTWPFVWATTWAQGPSQRNSSSPRPSCRYSAASRQFHFHSFFSWKKMCRSFLFKFERSAITWLVLTNCYKSHRRDLACLVWSFFKMAGTTWLFWTNHYRSHRRDLR